MEVYPEKMDGTPHHARSAVPSIFSGYTSIHRKIMTVIPYHLILNAIQTPKSQFDVNVANGVSIDVLNDVLPVWWMEVYPFRFDQSKSLLHAEIK